MSGRASNRKAAAAAAVLALAVFVVGCGRYIPSATVSPRLTAPAASPAESAGAAQSASGSVHLSIHAVPQRFTTPLLDVTTDGEAIAWSTGAEAGPHVAPDVFLIQPGTAPVKVFASSDRSAVAGPLSVSEAGVALIEANPERSPGRWRLLLVSEPGGHAVVVDASDAPASGRGPYPFMAMSHNALVWTAIHERSGAAQSELWMATLPGLRKTLLEHGPAQAVEYWFPALDGNRLVFGTVETTSTAIARHVYSRRLDRDEPSRRLDTTGHASMPSVAGDTVVWKETPDNVLERGTLVRYSLASQEAEAIAFGDEPAVNSPSVGDRFVAADAIDPTRFFIYDLETRRSIKLAAFPPAGQEVIVRPHLRGDLLTWAHAPADGSDLILEWSRLP